MTRFSIDMQDLKDLKSRFFKIGFAAANEYRRFTVARLPVPRECPVDRSTARDRPSPYGEGGAFFAQETLVTVARGPVPRDRCMARDRPSPYGEGGRLFSARSAGALGCHTRIRAGFPRERWGARARTMARDKFSHRSRFLLVVPREPQTFNQPFALRIFGEDVRYAGQLPGLMP